MALPTGLFVDAPEMQDPSLSQLSSEVEEWPEEIVSKVKERIPQTNSMNIIVKFMKEDEENGTATGSAIIGSASKQAVVPVIIKDFMLFPLDVFVIDGKLLPLTPDYFAAAFSNNAMFQKLEEYPTFGGLGRFEDSNLWNATYPPSLGRYAYASGDFKLTQEIADTMTAADLEEFKKLALEASVAVNFHKHGHLDAIKKIAHFQPVNMNEFRQGADNLIKKDIFMLKKEGPNKYSVLSGAQDVFSPAMTTITRENLYEFCSKISDRAEDTVNDVDQNGEKLIVTTGEHAANPYMEHEMLDSAKPELANEYDHYIVKDKAGIEHEGMVIPVVINFDMDQVPLKVFAGKTMSTVQEQIAGHRIANSRWQLEGQELRIGQTGVFFWHPKSNKSKALCTVPVTIQSIVERGPGNTEVKVMDLHGKSMTLKMSCDCHLQRIAPFGDHQYMMPEGFKWHPMEGFKEISNSPVDYAAKTAGQKSADPVTVVSTGFSQYSIKGADKYATAAGWDKTNLTSAQAQFLLASMGASVEKVAAIIKKAERSRSTIVHNLSRPLTKQEKIANAVPRAKQLMKIARGLKVNLIKEASFVENSQTVDTLLSLNFVNPENVSKFVGKLPQLKSAISSLASLMIASRLGMKEIPEQAASTAMYRLIDVVNGLEALRASQETAQ